MKTIKFATFNLHHGKDPSANYSHDAMLESVKSLEADILCIQELDVSALRTHFVDQPKLIAKNLGYEYVTSRVRFFGLGYQHNAIFSKLPIVSSEEMTLPQHGNQQLRKALIADVELDGQKIRVTTAHLHTHKGKAKYNEWARKQLMFLLEKHVSHDICLIGGDLNLLPDEVVNLAQDFGFVAPTEFLTSPAISPKQQIDWVLGKNIYLNEIRTSDVLCSDHRALIADVTDVPS